MALQGLNQLASIGGILKIRYNISLSDIRGLEHIASQSIQDLSIIYNQALSECSIERICGYLAAPNGATEIEYNAPGCSNMQEVVKACAGSGSDDGDNMHHGSQSKKVGNYPNPFHDFTTIEYELTENTNLKLTICNHLCQEVITLLNKPQLKGRQQVKVKTEDLPAGIYTILIITGNQAGCLKMIKR